MNSKIIITEISKLSERERRILEALYGDPPKTKPEVSAILGLSLQWVTRLERRGIRQISEILRRRKAVAAQILERMQDGTRKISNARRAQGQAG